MYDDQFIFSSSWLLDRDSNYGPWPVTLNFVKVQRPVTLIRNTEFEFAFQQ